MHRPPLAPFAVPVLRRAAAAIAVTALALTTAACASSGGPTADPTASVAYDVVPVIVEDGLDAELSAAIEDALASSFAEISAPGAVVAVRTADGTFIATIGSEDYDGDPMSADVNQRIGSVTKTFTVTALLQLAQDGLLSLDDPIGAYFPDVPNPDATLLQLAKMQSGIPSYTFDDDFFAAFLADTSATWAPEQLVAVIQGSEPNFEPGTQMQYSNTNTVLLGMVIEQVTGQTLSEVIDERIAQPLGLSDTFLPTGTEFPEPHARGYTLQGQPDTTPVDATDWNPSWGWAAGGMISTVDDLLTYGRALVAGDDALLGSDMQTLRLESFDADVPPNSETRAYGIGIGRTFGWYGHTGELPGYNTVLQHELDEDITLVVMADSDIKSGECSEDPVLPDGRTTGVCDDPAVHIANAVSDALGFPLVAG